jgi:hypothetical protein
MACLEWRDIIWRPWTVEWKELWAGAMNMLPSKEQPEDENDDDEDIYEDISEDISEEAKEPIEDETDDGDTKDKNKENDDGDTKDENDENDDIIVTEIQES